MKKLLTLLFAVAVAFSLTMPVFAQETTTATTTTKAKKTKATKATKAKKTKKTTTATTTAP
jgi:hypothetical protein